MFHVGATALGAGGEHEFRWVCFEWVVASDGAAACEWIKGFHLIKIINKPYLIIFQTFYWKKLEAAIL